MGSRLRKVTVLMGVLTLFAAGCRSAKMQTAGRSPSPSASAVPGSQIPLDAPPEPAEDFAPTNEIPTGNQPTQPSSGACARFTSVNGQSGVGEVYVRPGDVVNMSADLFQAGVPAGMPPAEFLWRSDLQRADECGGSGSADCLGRNNFQITQSGAAFYVPYEFGQGAEISVEALDPRARGCGDKIRLRNMDFDGRPPQPVPSLITDPAAYAGRSLDPHQALAGHGRWVVIDGVRYFTPYTGATADAQWAPYQNGYWSWEEQGGVTWISYDPWGWLTDHYGVWRHHGSYGWVWLPFQDRRYQPHCVTWFNQGDHIGWYPYFAPYKAAYRHGARQGFDDGFWLGYRVGVGFGTSGYAYRPGFAIVPRHDLFRANVRGALLAGRAAREAVVRDSFQRRQVFPHPGGRDPLSARRFVEAPGRPLPVTVAAPVISRGGARIVQPRPIHVPPPEAPGAREHIRRPLPVVRGGHPAATVVTRTDATPPSRRLRPTPQPPSQPQPPVQDPVRDSRRRLSPQPNTPRDSEPGRESAKPRDEKPRDKRRQ